VSDRLDEPVDEPADDPADEPVDERGDAGPVSWWRRPVVQALALLGVLAYLPALTAAPGRMPADSKLYLYLDPGRLMADAVGTFDPRQFAGWVPHQHIAFIWPSGPWFWAFERAGITDWVAHRLWIGSIMLLAGLGARWCARQLGLVTLAALVAGVWFQVSLYVLPYVSRTSVMLLPWAGLPWIVGLAIRAARRPGWRDPALIALVVLTVGAVNATALAMIVPAPVLWLIHAPWARLCTWRAAAVVAVRTAALSIGVSLWWMAALVVQGRSGADVLPYSESLADVSYTATSPEVWRGLGYWLFYVRDPYAATTTESLRYLWSTPALVVSFLVPLVGLVAIVWVRWIHRRFAALLIVAGVVLAVGVHPIDDRSPLMRVLTRNGDGGLALALRSSTRALPMMNLGLALSAGALIGAVGHVRWGRWWFDRILAAGVCGLVLLNVPGLWTGAFVDPALERDEQPPAAWLEAADRLDEDPDGGRVLMLPGTEFGAYRWGYTVDQPLPGLTGRELVTRDLLPLGSPAAMDLLFAFDDRFQEGVAESESLGPIARLLGVDTVWLTNDVAFDRFRLARPEVVRATVMDADAVRAVEPFGEPTVNDPDVGMIDERSIGDADVGEPHAPVELVELDTSGDRVRAYARTLLVAAGGDGLVDLAAAGLLPDDVGVRSAADDPEPSPTDVGVVVTDSNRDRARQWRSSQDTHGFTESGGPDDDLLRSVASDARLPVFEDETSDDQTIARQVGPVTAVVTSYGEPFAYLPERRAVMAIDGDPATAWIVGEHADPIGEAIELSFPDGSPSSSVRLRQPVIAGNRQVTEVLLTQAGGAGPPTGPPERIAIVTDADGWSQTIDLAPGTTRLRVEISRVDGGTPLTASVVAGVGFSEIDLGLEPTREVVRPPLIGGIEADMPWAWVATRWRTDATDRWRSDPEPTMVRSVVTEHDRVVTPTPTVRIDPRATDAELAALFGWPVVASERLTGVPRAAGIAAFDGDPSTAWTTGFGRSIGASVTINDVTTDVSSLTITQPDPTLSRVTAVEVVDVEGVQLAPLITGGDGVARIELPRPARAGTIEVRIAEIEPTTTVDRRFADPVELPVALGEIAFDGAPLLASIEEATAEVPCTTIAELDGTPLTAALTVDGPGWLDGRPIVAEACEREIPLTTGEHLLGGVDGVFQLDRIVLDDRVAAALDAGDGSMPVVVTLEDGRFGGSYRVSGCEQGCWFVDGYGHNDAWEVAIDGIEGGPPALLDGGFNGWWIRPADGSVDVVVRWSAQVPLTVALVLSALTAAGAIGIVVALWWRRRRRRSVVAPADLTITRWASDRGRFTGRSVIWWAVAWCLAGGLLIGPWGALWGAIAGLVLWITRRRDLAALVAVATVAGVSMFVVVNERRWSPSPDGGWPNEFEAVHALGMFAAVALLIAALTADDATAERDQHRPAEEPAPPATSALPSEP
jgi:arabinofuranan 3-O-arabinosyltransferase